MSNLDDKEVLVRFISPHAELQVPQQAISVPSSLNRVGLSLIINHLLGKEAEDDDGTQFEFIISSSQFSDIKKKVDADPTSLSAVKKTVSGGRSLLRSTLRKYISGFGLSTEDIISLEFAPSLSKPEESNSSEMDDWISVIDCSEDLVFSGQYDGSLTAIPLSSFSAGSTKSAVSKVSEKLHDDQIVGISSWELPSRDSSTLCAVVTSSMDCSIKLWSFQKSASANSRFEQKCTLQGFEGAPSRVSIDPSGRFVAAGDSKGNVFVWNVSAFTSATALTAVASAPAKKRSREDSQSLPVLQPVVRLERVHRERVSSVIWLSSSSIASGSFDHTICVWNVSDVTEAESPDAADAQKEIRISRIPQNVLRTGRVVNALSCSPLGGLIAAAHPDNCVRVWSTSQSASVTLSANASSVNAEGKSEEIVSSEGAGLRVVLPCAAWVSDCAFARTNGHLVAVAVQDGSVSLFDVRSPSNPLFVLHKGEQKALAVAWSGKNSIFYGGEDKVLKCSIIN